MHESMAQNESLADRVGRSAVTSCIALPIVCVALAGIAAWLVPTVRYVQASVTRYELRYVEGVGNVEYPAGSRKERVRLYESPTDEEAMRRLPSFLISGAIVGALAGAGLYLRNRRLYKNGRRLYFEDGDLLPITGEPIVGEVLPSIRGIGQS